MILEGFIWGDIQIELIRERKNLNAKVTQTEGVGLGWVSGRKNGDSGTTRRERHCQRHKYGDLLTNLL